MFSSIQTIACFHYLVISHGFNQVKFLIMTIDFNICIEKFTSFGSAKN